MHKLEYYSPIIDDIENGKNSECEQKMLLSCLSKGVKIIIDDQEICNDVRETYLTYKIYKIDDKWIARIKKNELDILMDELNGKEPLCGDYCLGDNYLSNANNLIDDDSDDIKIIKTIETSIDTYRKDLEQIEESNRLMINQNPDVYINTRYYRSEDVYIANKKVI